jgi:hypothetical protein
VAWFSGFVLYQWILPAEIGRWQTILSSPFETLGLPFPLSDEVTWLSAAISSFLLAFAIDLAVPAVLRAIPAQRRKQQALS